MRVLVGAFGHETNTFSNVFTGVRHFEESRTLVGDEIPARLTGTKTGVGGVIDAARELGMELRFTVNAWAEPSGPVLASAYEHYVGMILAGLDAGPVDGVVLCLHGAMVALGTPDLDGEGELIARVRQRVGPNTPIVVALDLHTLLHDRILQGADVVNWYKTYPHVDMYERAYDLTHLLAKLIRREVTPTLAYKRLPMLAPPFAMRTSKEPMRGIVERMVELERDPRVLSVSYVHSFPWADVPYNCAAPVVYTNGDAALATQLADELAERLWSQRELLNDLPQPITDVVAQALREPKGPVVISDGSDNPGGGATGDCVETLRELLRREVDRAAVSTIWDPGATALCHNAGVGTEISLRLGGKVDAQHGNPIDVTGVVEYLGDGDFVYKGPINTGAPGRIGKCAVLRIPTKNGRVRVIIHNLRTQTLDPEVMRSVGVEPADERIVVVKSVVHFYDAFAPIAARIIGVEGPGIVPQRFASMPFRTMPRPMFPFDPL